MSEQRFIYSRCLGCDLRFESVRPREGDIFRFYPETYYDRRPRSAHSSAAPRPPTRRGRRGRAGVSKAKLDKVLRDPLPERLASAYEPAGTRLLLDYGCGSADFLDRARRNGWKTIGADISERVLDEVRERGHVALPALPEEWDEIADNSLQLVRMNHVIEHLYSPREILSAILRKLGSGGTIHVATPNPKSWTSVLFRSRWLGLDCPRHVILYPPTPLATLLREVGFSRVEVFYEVLTKDFARSLGYLLHDLTLLAHERILGMAEWDKLAAILRAPARVAARARVSDRIHCFAQK